MTLKGEKRKLQKTSTKKEKNNSFFIYIPKDWVEDKKLRKGDDLEIFKNDALVLFGGDISEEKRARLIDVLNSE